MIRARLLVCFITTTQSYNLHAATLNAVFHDVGIKIAAAKCGDIVALSGNVADRIVINTRPTCETTLDISGANVHAIMIQNASNWTITGDAHGGGVVGQDTLYNAVQIIGSDHLVLAGLTITGYGAKGGAGISLLDSNSVMIKNNDFKDALGDGIDVVSSQHISIIGNRCERLPYGVVVHTDCVQIWNKLNDPLTVADILVDHNEAHGHMQGFDTFGAGDPRPVVGVQITNNRAEIDIQWAGAINTPGVACRLCAIRGNTSKTGHGYPKNWKPVGWYDGPFEAPGNRSD